MSAAQSYKVVLVGDLDVGKTTLFNRFKLGDFVESEDERQTRQQAEHHKTWEYEGEQLSVSKSSRWGSVVVNPIYRCINLLLHDLRTGS